MRKVVSITPDRPRPRAFAMPWAGSRNPSPCPVPGGLLTLQGCAGRADRLRHSGNPQAGPARQLQPGMYAVLCTHGAPRRTGHRLQPAMPVPSRCGRPARQGARWAAGGICRACGADGKGHATLWHAGRNRSANPCGPALPVRRTVKYRSGWYGAARIAARPPRYPRRCAAYRGDRTGWSHPAATAWCAGSGNGTDHGRTARPTC